MKEFKWKHYYIQIWNEPTGLVMRMCDGFIAVYIDIDLKRDFWRKIKHNQRLVDSFTQGQMNNRFKEESVININNVINLEDYRK